MSRALKVRSCVLHCSSGYGDIHSIQNWWRNGLKWKSKGYHMVVALDGTIWYLKDNNAIHGYSLDPNDLNLEFITNGVAGYNTSSIHICYIGGVERNNVHKAFDSRTPEQKESLHKCIQTAIFWLIENGKDVTQNLGVVGHRDFSKDNNANGVIEPWERIKECPSWEVITEVGYLYSSPDRYGKLPYN